MQAPPTPANKKRERISERISKCVCWKRGLQV
jgi:hypothetical protein